MFEFGSLTCWRGGAEVAPMPPDMGEAVRRGSLTCFYMGKGGSYPLMFPGAAVQKVLPLFE
jgi:hypothetical protein